VVKGKSKALQIFAAVGLQGDESSGTRSTQAVPARRG
jgi:hypothetical protein